MTYKEVVSQNNEYKEDREKAADIPSILNEIKKRKFSFTPIVKYEVENCEVKGTWLYLFGLIPLRKSLSRRTANEF